MYTVFLSSQRYRSWQHLMSSSLHCAASGEVVMRGGLGSVRWERQAGHMPPSWIVLARHCIAALSLVLAPACTLTMGASGPPVLQRPTFSTTTETTPSGGLSLEMGADSGPKSQLGVPTTFRWGAGPNTEVTLGSLLHQRSAEGRTGIGDLELGTRQRLRAPGPDAPGWGWGWLARLPLASTDDGLGSGEIDVQLNISRDHLRGVSTITWYYQLDLLGEPGDEGTDMQHLASWSASRPLTGSWVLTAELAGATAPERDLDAAWALVSGHIRLDELSLLYLGIRMGAGDADDWSVSVGFGRGLGVLGAY